MIECNHDIDSPDATAQTFTNDYRWGRGPRQSHKLVYCFACKEALSFDVTCEGCGASWAEGLFIACPWCDGGLQKICREENR